MSDASSAGTARGTPGYGTTCRKDVLRGVEIPVMPGAAGRARPLPGGQAQVGEQVPARRARLRAGIPAVDHDQLAGVPLALVRQLAAELTPAAVRDCAGQMPVADHATDVKVLDHDEIGRTDQPSAGPVQEVPPRVTDLAVGAGDLGRSLGPVGRPLLAPSQAPLVAGQTAGLALQVPRVSDPLPVTGHGEVRHAQIDADGVPSLLQGFGGGGLGGEGDVPASVRLPGDDHHRRVQRGQVHVGPGPDEPDRSGHLGQPQFAAAQGERRPGVVRGLAGAAGLEPRVPGAPGEERGERLVLVPQSLLQRHAGHLVQECQAGVLLHSGQRPVGLRVGRARAVGGVAGLAGGQSTVPHHPDAAERARQYLLLRRVGVGPAPECRPHPDRIARLIEKPREPRRTGGCLFPPRCGRCISHSGTGPHDMVATPMLLRRHESGIHTPSGRREAMCGWSLGGARWLPASGEARCGRGFP